MGRKKNTPEQAMAAKERQKARSKAWREAHPDRVKAMARKHSKTPENIANRAAWSSANVVKREAIRHRSNLKLQYGITVEEYDRMHAEQNGVCALCRQRELVAKRERLSVDHCHRTNRVRGLLCGRCNTGIGMLGESSERLRAAADYLEKKS